MVDAQRARVEEVLGQLDVAYSSGDWHSLRGNLADVPADTWDWFRATFAIATSCRPDCTATGARFDIVR